jgi:hypothetical protein
VRVNARLDDDRSRKLELLTALTGATISDVLKRAIDLYYDTMRRDRLRPAEILEKEGFVGSAHGDPDLSENYETALEGILAGKHDHR